MLRFDEIIQEAIETAGIDVAMPGSGSLSNSAWTSLKAILMDWQNDDHTWLIRNITENLTPNSNICALPDSTAEVLTATVVRPGTDTDITLDRMRVEDYSDSTPKTRPGLPTRFWHRRDGPTTHLVLWQTPDLPYQIRIYTIDQPHITSTPDGHQQPSMPPTFQPALICALAHKLLLKVPPGNRWPNWMADEQRLRAETDDKYQRALMRNADKTITNPFNHGGG